MESYMIMSYSRDKQGTEIDISCDNLPIIKRVAMGMIRAGYKLHLVEMGDDYYKSIKLPKEQHGPTSTSLSP